MTIPLNAGLSGWTWDAGGTRTAVFGLTNPYWICVNMLLRASGIDGNVPTPLSTVAITITLTPSSYWDFTGTTIGIWEDVSFTGVGAIAVLLASITSMFTGNEFNVPMSNAANQAQVLLNLNLTNWQQLPAYNQTSVNQNTFITNFYTIWNAFDTACTQIYDSDMSSAEAKAALTRALVDRERGGKFDWYAAYLDPIVDSATPGNSITPPDTSAQQLATFVLSSLVNTDTWVDPYGDTQTGSGCAQIGDLQVPLILGTGNQTQFQFQGVIASPKPFRDWITEVLASCLGYFTWEFGQMKFGCRINASAVEAFTLGNMMYQSLKLAPVQAAFEHLVISFADVEYQYQANTAEYSDKDHAAYYGRAGAPLTAQMHSVGINELNQALRIATTRVREEVGGINAAEWTAARIATFNTTILALATEVGQVVSITHPDVPGGYGDFRIQSWKLLKDWSIQIQAKTVTVSMYNLDDGPKPADVIPAPLPVQFYPQSLGEWAPDEVQASASDALVPNEFTFDVDQTYTTNADGIMSASLVITGKLPENGFIPNCGAPGITTGTITQSTTGGYITDLTTLRVAICATNAAGICSPPSAIILVKTDVLANTNSFTINDINWPPVTGLTGYVVFAADNDDLICAQQTGTGQPSSITVTGPIARSTWGLPDPNVAKVRIKAKRLWHGGVEGANVDAVSGDTITAGECVDPENIDDWTGRVLSIIGRLGSSQPVANFNITGFDATTGTFTLDRPVVTGLATLNDVQVNDTLVVCFLGYDNSSNPLLFTDTGMSNAQDFPTPHVGLGVNNEVSFMIRVIAGFNRGATAKIVANGATSYTLDAPLYLDETSIIIVEEPNWEFIVDSAGITNSNPQLSTTLICPITNLLNTQLMIGGFTVDLNGVESSETDAPFRCAYLYGSGLTRTVTSSTTQLPSDGRIYFDTTAGNIVYTCISNSLVFSQFLTVQKISSDTNTVSIVKADGDYFFYDGGPTTYTLKKQGDTQLFKN